MPCWPGFTIDQLPQEKSMNNNPYSKVIRYAVDAFWEQYSKQLHLSESVEKRLKNLVDHFGESEVCTAIDIACQTYKDPQIAFNKIGGIAYNREQSEPLMDIFD